MCINRIRFFLKSKDRPLYQDFITTVIAALIGILIGFALEDWRTQKSMNEISKVRLHNMILESQFNAVTAYTKLETYKDTLSNNIAIKILEDFAAKAVFNDDNILNLITPDHLSFIKCYIDAINSVNHAIDLYVNYLSHIDFKITTHGVVMRNTIKKNCAELMASIVIIQEEFKFMSQDKAFRSNRIKEFQERLEKLYKEILEGKKIRFTSEFDQ